MRNQVHGRPDARAAGEASKQHSVVSTKQLKTAGLSKRGISDRVKAKRLFPMFRGSYCVGHEPLGDQAWIQAGVLVTDGEASHRSGAHLWGFRELRKGEPVEVTSTSALRDRSARKARNGRPAQPALKIHRTKGIANEGATRINGIKVVSAEQVLLDLAATRPYSEARRAVGQALVLKKVSVKSLIEKLDRAHGHHGIRALREIVATAMPTRSEAEDRLGELLADHQLSHWFKSNHYVEGVGELDFYSPTHNFAIEVDSREFHDNPIARADDYAKQKRAIARRIRIVRVRWMHITVEHNQTAALVVAILEEQSRHVVAPGSGMRN